MFSRTYCEGLNVKFKRWITSFSQKSKMPAKLLIECLSIYDRFDSVGAVVDNNGSYVIGSLPGRGRLCVPNIAQNHAVIWVQQNGVSLVPNMRHSQLTRDPAIYTPIRWPGQSVWDGRNPRRMWDHRIGVHPGTKLSVWSLIRWINSHGTKTLRTNISEMKALLTYEMVGSQGALTRERNPVDSIKFCHLWMP